MPDYVAYLRVYLRNKGNIEEAQKGLDKLAKAIDFDQDGLYSIDVTICNDKNAY